MRYSFDPITKELTALTPDEDASMSPRSRNICGYEVALTTAEADALSAGEYFRELESAIEIKTNALEASYMTDTELGFTSSALGTPHVYKSHKVAQLDLIGLKACNRSRKVWCSADGGTTWDLIMHSSTEIEQVLNDGADKKEAAFVNLVAKQTEIAAINNNAALTNVEKIYAIKSITW